MKYQDIVKKVSKETDIPPEVVNRAYKSYWKFIKQTIQELPLKNTFNEEDFSKLRTNFNVPSLGKMTCSFDRLKGIRKRFEYLKHLKDNESKEN